MSEQTIRVSRSIDVPAAMPWLVAIAVYLLLMGKHSVRAALRS